MVNLASQSTGLKQVKELAYISYDYYIDDNGWLVVRQPDIIRAKLKLFEHYFMPSPTNNLMLNIINDDMQKANKIVILEKKIVKRNRVIIIGSASIALYITIQVLIGSLK